MTMLPSSHMTVRDEYRAGSRSGVVSKCPLMIPAHRFSQFVNSAHRNAGVYTPAV
jgi:hypothetical protein